MSHESDKQRYTYYANVLIFSIVFVQLVQLILPNAKQLGIPLNPHGRFWSP